MDPSQSSRNECIDPKELLSSIKLDTDKPIPHILKKTLFGYATSAVAHMCLANIIRRNLDGDYSKSIDEFLINNEFCFSLSVSFDIFEEFNLIIPEDYLLYMTYGRKQGSLLLHNDFSSSFEENTNYPPVGSGELMAKKIYEIERTGVKKFLNTEGAVDFLTNFAYHLFYAECSKFKLPKYQDDIESLTDESIKLGNAFISYYSQFIDQSYKF